MRLQKLLAAAGLGSRRTVENWIREGRVTVGERVARLGDRAGPADEVRLDGERVAVERVPPERAAEPEAGLADASTAEPSHELLLYHKPLGEVTTRSDPQGRPTVFDHLPPPRHGRWIVIGRLDVNTSGLLLFTTDGDLAHRLMHPSAEVEREYRVRLRGTPGTETLRRLRRGIRLEDGPARFDRIVADPEANTVGSHSSFRVVLHEGRNREVRRLWAAQGFEVSRLARVRYGTVVLPASLRPGAWRRASPAELQRLRRALDRELGRLRDMPGRAPAEREIASTRELTELERTRRG